MLFKILYAISALAICTAVALLAGCAHTTPSAPAETATSDLGAWRLMVYDLENNQLITLNHSLKSLPITYDESHVYLDGVDAATLLP